MKSIPEEVDSAKSPKLSNVEILKKVLPQINLKRITSVDYETGSSRVTHSQLWDNNWGR